jgi:hypothetical protein
MAFSGFTWVDLAASLTDDQAFRVYGTTADAIATARKPIILPWAGTVLGLAFFASGNKTAGTASLKVFKNGSALSAALSWADSTQKNYASYAPGTYAFAAGDELDVRVTTDGSYAPTNLEVEAFIYVARTA